MKSGTRSAHCEIPQLQADQLTADTVSAPPVPPRHWLSLQNVFALSIQSPCWLLLPSVTCSATGRMGLTCSGLRHLWSWWVKKKSKVTLIMSNRETLKIVQVTKMVKHPPVLGNRSNSCFFTGFNVSIGIVFLLQEKNPVIDVPLFSDSL